MKGVRVAWKTVFVLVLLAAVSTAPAAGANLLLNPGLELGPGGGGSPESWWTYGECGQHSWAGRNSAGGVAFHSYLEGAWGGFGQDVSASSEPGDVIRLSVWAQAEGSYTSANHEAWIKLNLYTGGTTPAGECLLDVYGDLFQRRGSWNEYVIVLTNEVAGVDRMKVTVGGGGFTSGEGSRSVLWDDAELTVTPPAGSSRLAASLDAENACCLSWQGEGDRYYKVLVSETLTGRWTQVRGMKLGSNAEQAWRDEAALTDCSNLFYRLVSRPVNEPGDWDEDGLDDVTELRAGNLNPLDPDCDDDGIRDGLDPRPANPNEPPSIQQVLLVSAANRHNEGMITLAVLCFDPDGDAAEYRFTLNGGAPSLWQSASVPFSWQPNAVDSGSQVVMVTARDAHGAQSAQSASIHLFRTPPRP